MAFELNTNTASRTFHLLLLKRKASSALPTTIVVAKSKTPIMKSVATTLRSNEKISSATVRTWVTGSSK